ncbi:MULTISPECIES: LysR family transcriptional regulator [Streptomyces]|uniref:LysR family transcriptional regulator n=2 Tax=Streptomyces cacaoi TaxID=1898 RepID=A0A4Y3RDZ1_STRCI|nr:MULTISPECIES: LysR family transcriptional regulator [Streptomyces]NNG84840.1 LysR family transcriptional regulator [Streptomyces cacaoi]QHF96858.1 LysR family transcriptional regulator [Streptomyces sp. NHF165]GEB53960.1 LysR family transcriptional regulator [Streptomyces cacaoi]
MIDSRRLRTLQAVADHRTVTAAAAALYLTPSAVSQQIAALESEIGHRVLKRNGRGIQLTAVGKILLSHADAVLAQLERAEAELAAYTAGTAGEVTVASFATGIGLVVAPAVAALAERAPGLRVRVRDAEGDESLLMVLDGEADLAVGVDYRGAPRPDDQRLLRTPLYAEPFDAVLPAGHPLAAADRIALADLSGARWAGPYPGNPCHDVTVLACEYAGFEPQLEHYSDDFSAVVALVAAGDSVVAMVPRSALVGADGRGVVVRAVDGVTATRRVFAAVRSGVQGHPLVSPVLEALKEVAVGLDALRD